MSAVYRHAHVRAGNTSCTSTPAVTAVRVGASYQLPTWVVFEHADGVLVQVGLAGALEERDRINVCCGHRAVHSLHQLPHTGTNAPVAVKVHSVGLGQVIATVCCTDAKVVRQQEVRSDRRSAGQS
jgi:hypothetical protein